MKHVVFKKIVVSGAGMNEHLGGCSVDTLGGYRIGDEVSLRSHSTIRAPWHNKPATIVNFWPDLQKEVEVEIAGKVKFVRLRNISKDFPGKGSDTESYPAYPVRSENGAAAAQARPKNGVVLAGPAADKERIAELESMVKEVQAQTDHFRDTAELLRTGKRRQREESNAKLAEAQQVSENLAESAVRAKQDLADTGTVLTQVCEKAESTELWLREELDDSARVLATQVIENGNLRTQLQAEEENTRAAKRLCIGAALTGAALGVAACQALTTSVASVASAASNAFTVHGASVASRTATAFTVHAASFVFDVLAHMQ